MEITGQVWDELQAQNTRLHQLLREKDEENLKLMTERVKSNQLYNVAKEENENMTQIVTILLQYQNFISYLFRSR
jgi:E3 ubiquitin-protein ligase BRE1